MKKIWLSLWIVLACISGVNAADLWVEAESFAHKGGWKVDQQFMDLMGSPYLIAHGMGVPVEDAWTEVTFPKKGEYYVYVRTYNWTSPWKEGELGANSLCLSEAKSWFPLWVVKVQLGCGKLPANCRSRM